MNDHIKTRKASGTWVIRAGGAVLGESTNAVELSEGSRPPVIYFPREDIAMAFLEKSEHTTNCVHKGAATYYHIEAKSGRLQDAAWSYEAPLPGMEAVAGYISFYPDKVTLESL